MMANIKTEWLTKREIRALIAQETKHLIRDDSEVQYELSSAISEMFVKKDEYKEILIEIKSLHEASDRHSQEIKALREVTNKNTQEIKALHKASDRHTQAIDKNSQTIETLREDMDKNFNNLDNKLVGLGARWGMMSEESFRNGLKAILREETGLKVERYEGYDDEGVVFDQPDQIEMDIIVKDGVLILIEIKSSVSKSDVTIFQRKVEFYEKENNVKAHRKVIISPFIDTRTANFAQHLGIEVSTSALKIEI